MPRHVNYRVKIDHPFKILSRLMKYVYKINTYKIILVIILLIVSAVTQVSSMSLLKSLIDNVVPDLLANPENMTPLIVILLEMSGLFLVSIASTYAYAFIMVFITQDTLKILRDEMFYHMETLPIRYFDSRTIGEVMSTYTNDTDSLRQMISQSIPQITSSFITIISVFVMMVTTSWILTIVTVCSVFLMLIAIKIIGKRSSTYFMDNQIVLSKINGYIEEMIEGQKVIKVFNHEQEVKDGFDELNNHMRESNYRANKYAISLMPIIHNLGYVNFAVTAVVGSILAFSGFGGFTAGAFATFLLYNKQFTQPIGQVSNQINFIFMALAGAQRIFALLDEKGETDQGDVTLVNVKEENGNLIEVKEVTHHWAWKHIESDQSVRLIKLCGDVRFYDVTFGYDEDKTILHDISLYAKPGQKIAFVGATGAGKTTITNLINRFYDIQKGTITYDGIDIKKIKKEDLRRSLGIVLQDTHLFSGTIKDNIKYGKEDATDEEVYQAAKLAKADQFINLLEDGYDTYITGDGGNLSQGQRQLLAIARVAICNPPVLILDEATSSIDTWTESLVQEGMDELMKGRTVFVIAHRLSTVRNSDAIMVLDHGKIIERGSHAELIEKKGIYYQLYTGAFELE